MATPLLRQTRRAFPDARIDFQVAKPFAIALQGNSQLDSVSTFDPAIFTEHRIGEAFELAREIRRGRYDAIFILDKHPVFALIARLAGVPLRVGFTRDFAARLFLTHTASFRELRHDVHYNLDLLKAIDVEVDYEDTRMEFNRAGVTVEMPAESYLACTNSGGENVRETTGIRRLPSESFLELLKDLAARHITVLLGGGNDREYYNSLTLPDNVLNLAGKTSLAECAEIIAGADKFFTTDCGLMHLAATTETPIQTFFGPTHPKRKAPLRENVICHWSDSEIYDPEYDRRGKVPSREYFQTLVVAGCAG